MPTTRVPITGNPTPSPKDHSRGRRSKVRNFPRPMRPPSDGRSLALNWLENGKLSPHGCACAETEDLPRIILVSGDDTLMPELSRVLDPCPLEIRTLKSCLEAAHEIGCRTTADIIFTGVQLSDGDWRQVLQMARRSPARAEVILVSRFVDVGLYLDALEAGAFDFVVPPFHTVELGYIIVNAIYASLKKRTHSFSGNFVVETAV
jgi:CheY-like chemotaxis protein